MAGSRKNIRPPGQRPTRDGPKRPLEAESEERDGVILIVDDDNVSRTVLQADLEIKGYEVWAASSGKEALTLVESEGLPDLAILDVRMPGMDGLELGARLQKAADLPIVFLSGVDEPELMTRAIEKIAEDFVCKPYVTSVLLAKVHRILKRFRLLRPNAGSRIRIDDWLELQPSRRRSIVGGERVSLTFRENKLLLMLLRHEGRALSPSRLQAWISPQREYFDDGALRTLVYRLRKKIEPEPQTPKYVITDRGQGYRWGQP